MKQIYIIYLSQFLCGFAMIASFTPLYFLSHGISQYQLGLLLGANILTLSLFDIPTGAIADLFGHKFSVFLGTLIWSFSYLLLFFVSGFPLFLVCMIISGIGGSLISGAFTSLIYELLDKNGNRKDFQKVYGTAGGLFLVGSVIGVSAGGFIYQYQANLIFLVSFVFTFLGAMSMLLISSKKSRPSFSPYSYTTNMFKGFSFAIHNQSLLALSLLSIGLSFGIFVINTIKQPLLVDYGFSIPEIGYITAIVSGLSAFVLIYAHDILRQFGAFTTIISLGIICVLSLILISMASPMFAMILLILYQITPSLRDPAIADWQQSHIADAQRATVNSTVSFITRIVIAISLPLWGNITDAVGMRSSLLYLAFLTSVISVIGFHWYKQSILKKKKK